MLKKTVLEFVSISIGFLMYFNSSAQHPLFKNFSVSDGLASSRVYDIIQDTKGNLWLATDRGLSKFNGSKFQNYNTGLTDNDVVKIYEDYSGKIWFCSSSGKLNYCFNDKIYSFPAADEISKKLSGRILNSMYIDKSNNMWLGTVISGGLIKITDNKNIEQYPLVHSGDFSYYIKAIEKNGFIWGSNNRANANNKLRAFLGNSFLDITLSASTGYSKSLFIKLQRGNYFFAKDHEIVNFNDTSVIARAFLEKSVECLYEDSEGKIWIGLYSGGVLCYPNGNLSTGSLISYLGDRTVSSICEDNKGNIWFATIEDGVYYLSSNPFLSYTAPKIFSSDKIKNQRKFKRKSKLQRSTDLVISPNIEIPVVKTDSIKQDTLPPKIYISGLKIMNRDTVILNNYKLKYDQNFFKINFVGFSYDNAEKLQYKYKLSGIDEDWVYTNNTSVQYTTLPPGKYNFSVNTMNNKGIWSEEPASFSINISPPYWQTWLFRATITGGALGLFLSLFFIRLKQIKEKEKRKTILNKKIADIELQALRAQMNPHFVFNTLSSIQHYITNNDSEPATKYLSKFAKLMRSIMDNSRRPVIPLNDELKALELYLELEVLRCENKFEYSIEVDKSIDVNYDEIPSMLIQPYIENAIWHGLMPKGGMGKIKLNLNKINNMMICTIEDDGIGRKQSLELNKNKERKHQSLGMSITKERLEIINSINNSNLNVNIIDLHDNAGNTCGTRVEIFVPVNN